MHAHSPHSRSSTLRPCRRLLLLLTVVLLVSLFPSKGAASTQSTKVLQAPATGSTTLTTTVASPTIVATIPTGSTAPQQMGLDIDYATNRIYTTTAFPANMVVIDGATNMVTTSVPVSQNLADDLAINTKTHRIFVVSSIVDEKLLMYDSNTNAYISSVFIGSQPDSVAINTTTNRVYVGSIQQPYRVTVVNGVTNSIITTISVGNQPVAIGVNESTNRIYTANYIDNTISVIDGTTNRVIATIPVATDPENISIDESDNRIYVANWGGQVVTVIDGITNKVLATIAMPDATLSVAVNPNLHRLYAGIQSNPASLVVVDTDTNTIIGNPIVVGDIPTRIKFNPVSNRIYVANIYSDTITVLQDSPLDLSINGPERLSVVNGEYSPNPFEVTAIVTNKSTTTQNNVEVFLGLPDELDYALSSNPIYSIGSLAPGEQRQASWFVRTYPVESYSFDITQDTTLSYSATARATNVDSSSVEQQIILTAVPGDNFNDNKISPSLWIDDVVQPITSLEEANGQLEIAFPSIILKEGQKLPEQWSRGYTSACQLRGDFDIRVDYHLLTWPSTNGVRVGIVTSEAGSILRASYGSSSDFPSQPREVYATEHTKPIGIGKDVVSVTTNDSDGTLRLVRSGNTSVGYFLSAGSWTQVAQGSATNRDTDFSIIAWTYGNTFANQAVKIAFDNFTVYNGQLLCDGDGDGLLDDWETNGIDINKDGVKDLILNTNPKHKDLFVEIDYMSCELQGANCGFHVSSSHKPVDGALDDVVQAFAHAPVPNPDNVPGINLHAVLDEAVPEIEEISFDASTISSYDDFDDIKNGGVLPCHGYFGNKQDRSSNNCANILAAKRLVYRYVIFGHSLLGNDASGRGETPGNDAIVTLGGWYNTQSLGGYREAEAAAFMHELGHTLGLTHGGSLFNNANCKPNY